MTRRSTEDTKSTNALDALGGKTRVTAISIWTGADETKIAAMVNAVTALGDAVLLGTTSDGGAATLLVFHEGQKKRLYASSDDELNSTLDLISEWARSIA